MDKRSGLKVRNAHQVDQSRAGYSPPSEGPFKCSNCEYFILAHACRIVKGRIEGEGCCCLYSRKNKD